MATDLTYTPVDEQIVLADAARVIDEPVDLAGEIRRTREAVETLAHLAIRQDEAPPEWHNETLTATAPISLHRNGRRYLAILTPVLLSGVTINAGGLMHVTSLRPGWTVLPYPDGSLLSTAAGVTQLVGILATDRVDGVGLATLTPPATILTAQSYTLTAAGTVISFPSLDYDGVDVLLSGISFAGGTSPQLTINVNTVDGNTVVHNIWTSTQGPGGQDQRAIGYGVQQNVLLGATVSVSVTISGAPTSVTFYLEVIGRYH
jgi:hypothetical protein